MHQLILPSKLLVTCVRVREPGMLSPKAARVPRGGGSGCCAVLAPRGLRGWGLRRAGVRGGSGAAAGGEAALPPRAGCGGAVGAGCRRAHAMSFAPTCLTREGRGVANRAVSVAGCAALLCGVSRPGPLTGVRSPDGLG